MRTALLLIVASILGTACFPETRSDRRDRYDTTQPQAFEAYTTDGNYVTVQQDPRTDDLFIVQPEELRGERVAIVNRNDRGQVLVTRDVQTRRRQEGSGGDEQRRGDDHRRDDDHR
jgi:hypothetical protein